MSKDIIQQLHRKLEDHEKRISALESKEAKPTTAETQKYKKNNTKHKGEDLFPPIQKLLEGGFFTEWRTDLEVCNILKVRLLTKKSPLRASVVNVLRAMVKRGLLIREHIEKDKRLVFAYKRAS